MRNGSVMIHDGSGLSGFQAVKYTPEFTTGKTIPQNPVFLS